MKNENILKDRAIELAKPLVQEEKEEGYIEVLEFHLADERYGIETKYAREIHLLKDYTLLPCAPKYFFGLINVRRKIMAVINLKVLFNLPEDIKQQSKVVIAHYGKNEFGLLCDGFVGIHKVSQDTIQNAPPTLTGIRQELIRGVALDGLIILDGNKLLTCKQIVVEQMVEI